MSPAFNMQAAMKKTQQENKRLRRLLERWLEIETARLGVAEHELEEDTRKELKR